MANNILDEKKKIRKKKKGICNSISYTTGDIGLNIDHFNRAMGTDFVSAEGNAKTCENSGEALVEAKRYVRRYYFRPMNKFASNKAEILKKLIEIGNQNCTIYTLNNLGDEKDVSKLTSNDIIYTYDNGILKDKNGVRIMDYDLSIKKEEKRKKFADVDKAPEKEFKQEYSDRMTDATELEEEINKNRLTFSIEELRMALSTASSQHSIIDLGESAPMDENACTYNWEIAVEGPQIRVTGWGYNVYTEEDNIEDTEYFDSVEAVYEYLEGIVKADPYTKLSLNIRDAFNLDFDDINVYGEKLTEAKERFCCVCGEPIEGRGDNPEPFMSADDGLACHGCFLKFVAPLKREMTEEE